MVEPSLADSWGVLAVVIGAVGVGAQVNGCAERAQGDVVSLEDVAEDLARKWRVARPDAELGCDGGGDVDGARTEHPFGPPATTGQAFGPKSGRGEALNRA